MDQDSHTSFISSDSVDNPGQDSHLLCQFFSKLGTYNYRFVVLLNVCSASSQQVLVNGSYCCDC